MRVLPALLPTVTPPETVNIGLPLAANRSVAVPAVAPQICRLVHSALLRSLVTVTPLLMVTVSPATGTALPPQVAVELQLPETDAVRAAALADVAFISVANAASADASNESREADFLGLKTTAAEDGEAGDGGLSGRWVGTNDGALVPRVFITLVKREDS